MISADDPVGLRGHAEQLAEHPVGRFRRRRDDQDVARLAYVDRRMDHQVVARLARDGQGAAGSFGDG